MNPVTVEICAGSLADCKIAQECGANRIELNSALPLGGLTPSGALLKAVKTQVSLPVICMVRPRAGGFDYDEEEFDLMLAQAKELLEAGADGIAFGVMTPDRHVDANRTGQMIRLIHSYNKEAVFHRAFDLSASPLEDLEVLADLGVSRILTSGAAVNVTEGSPMLKALAEAARGRIDILAGCGVSPENAPGLIADTGVSQIHASCSHAIDDAGAMANGVDFSENGRPYRAACSKEKAKKLVQAIRNLE